MIEDISDAEAGRRAAQGLRDGTIRPCNQWTPKGPCKLPMNHGFAHDGIHGPEVNYGGHPWDEDLPDEDDDPSALARKVLKCPMIQPNDARAETVKDFLIALLVTLWEEEEGFSGKRPLGNSDWQPQVYESLAKAGLIDAEFDEWGYIDNIDYKHVDSLIIAAIRSLRPPKKETR
jgi:hypothetical protein